MQSKAPKKLLWKRLSILAPFTGKKKKKISKTEIVGFDPKYRVPSQTTTEMASRPGTTLSAYKSFSSGAASVKWLSYPRAFPAQHSEFSFIPYQSSPTYPDFTFRP